MPIYIYRGGSPNPEPQNPLVRFLISAAIIAAVVGLGILLLPVFGFFAMLALGLIAVVVIGGLIYRWIYGSPLDNSYRRQRQQWQGMRVNPDQRPDTEPVREAREGQTPGRKMKFRSREQTVEDAIVVQERKRESTE